LRADRAEKTQQDECKELKQEVLRRQEREERLQLGVEREEGNVKAPQTKLDALEEKAGDLRTNLAVAQAQLASTEDDVKRRQEREEKREGEIGELQLQLQELTRVRDIMVSERERREGEVAADADRAALQQQMLEDRLAAAASEVKQLQTQVAGLEQVIKATGVELTCCTSSLEAKAAEVCALTEKLEQQKEEKESADMKGKLALEAITKECDREKSCLCQQHSRERKQRTHVEVGGAGRQGG
jgi:chromosome segregation ATPase